MKDKFVGELKWIEPSKLILNKDDKVGGFFLGLGAIFNDLKGLLWFSKMLKENYELPTEQEATCHAGDYTGIDVQIQKLMSSVVNEFFIFIEEHRGIFDESEFIEIFNSLSKRDQQIWKSIISIARGESPTATELMKSIVQIRSNLAFHYDHSGKILKRGYLSRFFGKVKEKRNEFAYYSIGENIEQTRFYFSDAAVQEAIFTMAGKKEGENYKNDPSLEKYSGQVMEVVNVMSPTITGIMKKYIQSRRNRS